MASEYLRPSLKMCPASMQRAMRNAAPQEAQASPSRIERRSNQWSTATSRSTSTPSRWTSSSLAPVVMPERERRASSA